MCIRLFTLVANVAKIVLLLMACCQTFKYTGIPKRQNARIPKCNTIASDEPMRTRQLMFWLFDEKVVENHTYILGRPVFFSLCVRVCFDLQLL